MKKHNYRIIISAGGTGGHIFPALAVARAIKTMDPTTEILFVGAEGRMEMEKIPQAGFPIIGLKIAGFQRKLSLKNFLLPFKILKSLRKAGSILKDFRPHIVAGFGGYASGPVLRKASSYKIPTILQEQNSFPGLTNKLLAKKASKIFVAYENMDKFFDAKKIVLSGNPVRKEFVDMQINRDEAVKFFGLDPSKFTVLAVGGSLGARTINLALCEAVPELEKKDIQLIWQSGKNYVVKMCEKVHSDGSKGIVIKEFIKEMDMAYAAADLVISRAGAIAISELQNVGKPVVFIPSPNVAEDHQTKNAKALVEKNAALLLPDIEAKEKIGDLIMELYGNENRRVELSKNIKELAYPDAAETIARCILDMAKEKREKNGNGHS
jgi:UDP-N-acetylglucosamine--N-acetylmuramyl-(pentapeptide) pyrophosphoryl-undecaprenol N-acetylglucosamine transferase